MGQRANLIIVENGRYDLYYSHWRASTLDRDLFWGPKYATAFIRAQKAVDESGWLDDVWAEGGVVLDHDKRVLLFFGGEDVCYDVLLRRVYLDLIRRVWSGWNVRWACEGVADIADYVGYPRERVLTDSVNEIQLDRLDITDRWITTLISVRGERGAVKIYRFRPRPQDILHAGPALLDHLRLLNGRARLTIENQGFPRSGVHIDVPNASIDLWMAFCAPRVRVVADAWPGWRIGWHKDWFESHFELLREHVVLVPPNRSVQIRLIRDLLFRDIGKSGVDFVLDVAEQMRKEHRDLNINPSALADAQLDVPKDVRAAIWNAAIAAETNT